MKSRSTTIVTLEVKPVGAGAEGRDLGHSLGPPGDSPPGRDRQTPPTTPPCYRHPAFAHSHLHPQALLGPRPQPHRPLKPAAVLSPTWAPEGAPRDWPGSFPQLVQTGLGRVRPLQASFQASGAQHFPGLSKGWGAWARPLLAGPEGGSQLCPLWQARHSARQIQPFV